MLEKKALCIFDSGIIEMRLTGQRYGKQIMKKYHGGIFFIIAIGGDICKEINGFWMRLPTPKVRE